MTIIFEMQPAVAIALAGMVATPVIFRIAIIVCAKARNAASASEQALQSP